MFLVFWIISVSKLSLSKFGLIIVSLPNSKDCLLRGLL